MLCFLFLLQNFDCGYVMVLFCGLIALSRSARDAQCGSVLGQTGSGTNLIKGIRG